MEPPDADERTYGELFLLGLTLGVVHVLSGPDHLSALATLSAGSSWRAALIGMRWGVGHSIGLVLCAVLFIYLDADLQGFGRVGEPLVGVFMMALGLYSTRQACIYGQQHGVGGSPSCLWRVAAAEGGPAVDSTEQAEKEKRSDDETAPLTSRLKPGASEPTDADAEDTTPAHGGHSHGFNEMSPHRTKAAALCIGIVHGVAGPGGILGVLPAVSLHNWRKSTLYLSASAAGRATRRSAAPAIRCAPVAAAVEVAPLSPRPRRHSASHPSSPWVALRHATASSPCAAWRAAACAAHPPRRRRARECDTGPHTSYCSGRPYFRWLSARSG